jgi:hypothetical protein
MRASRWSRSRPVAAGELLRRTRRVDRPNRAHRPDADLRRAAPPQGACRLRRTLQQATAASSAATAPATSRTGGRGSRAPADPASTGPRRADQRVRTPQPETADQTHQRILEPDRVVQYVLALAQQLDERDPQLPDELAGFRAGCWIRRADRPAGVVGERRVAQCASTALDARKRRSLHTDRSICASHALSSSRQQACARKAGCHGGVIACLHRLISPELGLYPAVAEYLADWATGQDAGTRSPSQRGAGGRGTRG